MPKTKTLVKICGITSKEQAIRIAELGTDAIGIISVEESPRYISNENKKAIFNILEASYPKIERVSVYKNCPINQIIDNFLAIPNETIIQLHGDEDIAYCKKIKKEIPNVGLWKAFRIKNKSDLEKVKPYESTIDAILLDSWNEETYGGSGKRIKSNYLSNVKFTKPWWLAGGISIDWIDEILSNIRPDGLDISSRIEIYPGVKNLEATKNLIYKIKNSIVI